MYEIEYQNRRITISMGQFHNWTLQYKNGDIVRERVETLHSQSCYGEITHHFHSQLMTPIINTHIRTYFETLTNATDLENCMEKLRYFPYDSVWSLYSRTELLQLIQNIREILRNQYDIDHTVYLNQNDYVFRTPLSVTDYPYQILRHQLTVDAFDILPHELFFILNVYRRLFTLSNKKTNDIVFALTKNATEKWCDLDAVALLILFDYFNTYSPTDSRIGCCYSNSLNLLKCFLNADSFTQFCVDDKIQEQGEFKYNDIFAAIVRDEAVTRYINNTSDSDCANIAVNYGLPVPFLFYNQSYRISLENLLTPVICTDEIVNKIETYIGFLKAIMANNKTNSLN